MKIRLSLILTILLIGLVGGSALVSAQGTPTPLGIIPSPNPGSLTVNVWTDKSTYMIGETAQVYFTVNQQAYIYLYDLQPDGIVRLVFPNAYSQNNFVAAGTHVLPDANYQFVIAPPTGLEQLQIFASLTPLNLTPSAYGEPYPQATPQGIQGQIMGITPQSTWVTSWTSFTIVASYGYTPPSTGYTPPPPGYTPSPPSYAPPSWYYPYPPFFGWGSGGTWYWSNGQWQCGIPSSGWYWYFGPDMKWHFRIRIQIGGS